LTTTIPTLGDKSKLLKRKEIYKHYLKIDYLKHQNERVGRARTEITLRTAQVLKRSERCVLPEGSGSTLLYDPINIKTQKQALSSQGHHEEVFARPHFIFAENIRLEEWEERRERKEQP